MTSLNLSSFIVKNDSLVSSQLDDGLVMMSLENNSYYGLDSIGKRIWEITDNKITVQELINQLVIEYNVSEEQCKNDVTTLLNELKKQDIIMFE